MLDMELQRRIRERKTPLALTLAPDPARLSEKILKNFTDMFGDTPMAQAEALRYHGTTLLDAAEGRLPAVVIQGGAYLSRGMMGADVLANLISAAHAKGLYVILDMEAAAPGCWAAYGADAVTVSPYGGSACLEAGGMLPVAAGRCRRWWRATGRCGCPWRSRWRGGARRCRCPRGTALTCGMCGGSAPMPSCCCRTATVKTRCRPLTTWDTARC